MIDLHCHSTFSDGTLTPEELVKLAFSGNLKALALTDHDTTAGIESFISAGRALTGDALECVSGVEISVQVSRGTMHILGYFLDHRNAELEVALQPVRNGREIRNQKILGKLNALGCDVTWDEITAMAGEDVVGRPHFAAAMIAKGFVKDKQNAFDRYLAKGKRAYEDRFRLSPEAGIQMIRAAGGVAVLAHPVTLNLGKQALRDRVADLRDMGLSGLEIYYPLHAPPQVKEYLKIARKCDLVPSGGSDFHGDLNPAIKLGRGFGSLHVDDDLLETLRARI